ncbi:DUF1847 domain-containing protein [Desulfitobacterium sp. Sab5]|uniref:DUF1847 domain-containing protein n=1 Tax=Desulfitobacterium nosdiversum TaxID=3375356 RepID=UPI003CF1F92D
MDCTKCSIKGCRKQEPCSDRSHDYIEKYASSDYQIYTKTASELIDNGRAGTLTRLNEIVEYCQLRGYIKIGVAYCYSMEKDALLLRNYLKQNNLKPTMISCTVDGIKESQIDPNKTTNVVSCNPLGQANILNSSDVEFTLLMGLCLGHDILLQKNLKMDFTTFVVKDRVLQHNPLLGLPGHQPLEDTFIEEIPNDFNLIKVEEFKTKVKNQQSPEDLYLLDLRNADSFKQNGIPGSIHCTLNDLPKQYMKILPDKRKEIILYCNGGIQSIYGVMFLSLKGYKKVNSLAGGFSKYLQSLLQ